MIKFTINITLALIITLASYSYADVVDAPHNESNGIKCSTCHSYSAWWQYSPADSGSAAYRTRINSVCLNCHDTGSSAPAMQSHNSDILSDKHGIWNQDCIDCHDPHIQSQLISWLSENQDELFLVTGQISTIDNGDGTFSYSYTKNPDNTTDIDIQSFAAPSLQWQNPASWSNKNNNPLFDRGLILVHGTSDAYNTYSVLSATASSITIRGSFKPAGVDPNLDASFGLIYGQLIKSEIMAQSVNAPGLFTKKTVKFFDPTQLNSLGGFTDQETSRQGICQVCHVKTTFWTEDGLKDGHNSDKTCTECHLREESFKKPAMGHANSDGIFGWDTECKNCHDPENIAEIINDVHQVGTKNSCTLCHLGESGGEIDTNTSAGNAVIGSTPHLCSECHLNYIDLHHASSKAQWGDCTWCHADPRPQWGIDFSVTGSRPRQLACRQCHIEASGTGLIVYKLDFPVTPSDSMTFPFGDLGLPANNSKSVIKTIMDGTNGTTNHSITGVNKIDVYDFGACLSCHDGVTATAVNIWHARPKFSEIPTDSSTDAARMHFDVLNYAPGRNIFNLWRGDGQQGEPYFSHDEKFYDTSGAARVRGKDFFGGQNRRNIAWNTGYASSPFSMTQVPCFKNAGFGNDVEGLCGENTSASFDLVPVFDDGPSLDNIQVTYAAYDGTDLLLTATNSNGDLSITYNGIDYGPMTMINDNNWVKNISMPSLTVSTVDIITTNSLGTNIIGYPICNEDLVSFIDANWVSTSANTGTLTVSASNEKGSGGQLEVSYNNSAYPMAYDAGQGHWSAVISQVPFVKTVDISSQCGFTLNNPVTDTSDMLQVSSATWDGEYLSISATNTYAGANLYADYNGMTAIPLIESPANTWSLMVAQPLYSSTVRIWSDTYADITANVSIINPGLYPPFCNSADNRDRILTPFDKSRVDPADLDKLHVDVVNLIDTSYEAQLYLTYSETSDGNTRYNLQRVAYRTFEFKDFGFTWTPGATVTVWSEDSQGTVMGIACNQPVYNRSLSDTITILHAEWTPENGGTLDVHAENLGNNSLAVYLDYNNISTAPMTWNAAHDHWQFTINNVPYYRYVRVYSDGNGDTTTEVADLTPDPITITQAAWRSVDNSDILAVKASNTLLGETSLFADYNGVTGIPLAWNGLDEIWELSISQIGFAPTIRIWSHRPGESEVYVNDMTNTHLDLTITQDCGQCHLDQDVIFGVHRAICATCHNSPDPVVQNVISAAVGGECISCHIPASGRIIVSEIDFAEETLTIPLKDHLRPDSDIRIPVPAYLWETRNEPIAVRKNTPMAITVRFEAQPGITSARISSQLFGSQTVSFNNGLSGYYIFDLPASYSSTVGVKQIDIPWQYCDENGTGLPNCETAEPLHISSHKLIVTHAYPVGQAPYYAKLVELSAQWSQDAVTEQEIVDSIFDGIAILGAYGYQYVYPFLGRTMNNVADILRQKEGACGEWSSFLLRAIEVQGIDVYKVDIVPSLYDEYIIETPALGTTEDLWFFGDHAFVIYGADISDVNAPYAGTAYDPSFVITGPGWGGYEDVIVPYFLDNQMWIANPGYGNGPADDENNSHVLSYSDDHIFVEE